MHLITEKIFLPVFAALPLRGSGPAGKYVMTAKPLCWVPYYSVDLNHDHGAKPCCKYDYVQEPLPYADISQFYSSQSQQWRDQHFLGDQLKPACSACSVPSTVFNYSQEKQQQYEKMGWTRPHQAQLRQIFLSMDNLCASSCIQCGPHFSTRLNNLVRSHSDQIAITKPLPGLRSFPIEQLDGLLEHLEILHLSGGDPLLSTNLASVIEKIRAQAPRLRLITVSTGLCRIRQSNIDLLSSLGVPIRCSVSLDGPMALNQWIRGITEEEFYQGWSMLIKSPIEVVGHQITLGCYNAFALPEFCQFVQELWQTSRPGQQPYIHSTSVLHPESLCVRQLPDQYKQQVRKKIIDYRAQAPDWARKFMITMLNQMRLPSTVPWSQSITRTEAYGRARGESHTWQSWYDHYMSIPH